GSGYHAEGGAACAAVPTPTDAPPTPISTPAPTPKPPLPPPTPVPPLPGPSCTPPPSGPDGRFNPQVCEVYSETSPGSHPDIGSTLSLGLGPDTRPHTADDTGDYMLGGLVNLVPTAPQDTEIPDGAVLGAIDAGASLGLLNNACVTR